MLPVTALYDLIISENSLIRPCPPPYPSSRLSKDSDCETFCSEGGRVDKWAVHLPLTHLHAFPPPWLNYIIFDNGLQHLIQLYLKFKLNWDFKPLTMATDDTRRFILSSVSFWKGEEGVYESFKPSDHNDIDFEQNLSNPKLPFSKPSSIYMCLVEAFADCWCVWEVNMQISSFER